MAPSPKATFEAEKNVIIGNTALYGATSGKAYIRGVAGERFAVRNSGASVVVEGVGDHGCEYMTGGRVVVLGQTGRNFAAGMSGGVAYVYDEAGDFFKQCNLEMVLLERVETEADMSELRSMIEAHVEYTNSAIGSELLSDWMHSITRFVKVIPKDYKRMLEQIQKAEDSGLAGDEALLAAFEANKRELARAGGK
ncbi:Ferredoxin-dependent glutamate synthase 1 [compost metagenome]